MNRTPKSTTHKNIKITKTGLVGEDHDSLRMLPSNVVFPDGDILVAYHNTSDSLPGEQIHFIKSKDGGKSWKETSTGIRSQYAKGGVESSTTLTLLKDGTLIMPYIDTYYVDLKRLYRHVNLYTAVSSDAGNSWEVQGPFASTMIETFPYGRVVELNDFLMMAVCGSDKDYGVGNWRVKTMLTSNTVSTYLDWYIHTAITKKQGDETTIVNLGKNELVAVIRGYDDNILDPNKNHRKHPFYISWSNTAGKFWSKPKKLPIRGTTPSLYLTPKGNLLLGYRKVIDAETVVCYVAVSKDNGHTWEHGKELQLPKGYEWYHGGYPTFSTMPDQKIFVTFQNLYPRESVFYNIIEEL